MKHYLKLNEVYAKKKVTQDDSKSWKLVADGRVWGTYFPSSFLEFSGKTLQGEGGNAGGNRKNLEKRWWAEKAGGGNE